MSIFWYDRRIKILCRSGYWHRIGAATGNLGIGFGIGIAFGAAFSQTKNKQKNTDPDSSEEED